MKKNLFFGLFATMVLLLTTACQQDEVFVDGNATVTFKVSTPDMVTRGEQFSKGSLATNLQYWVYDANGNRLADLDGKAEINSGAATTVTIDLAAGKTYSVLFWASAEDAPYSISAEGKTMTVDYEGDCNDEKRDAFYKWYTFQVNDNKPQDVELLRPFAQLNIGTNDIAKAEDAGVNVTNTAVKVQGVKAQVYKTLNFADGTVEDAVNVEFTTFTRPDGYDFPVEGYEYLAMNYVLVPATKIVVDEVVLSFDDQTRTYTNIPLQRNHRTNIYGSLLTKGIGFNVEINNSYDNEDDMTNVTVFSAQDLQAALDAAPANATTVITLGANIEANVTDIQKPGRKVVIEGNGNKYNGTIKVHSNSNYYDDAALTIKNVNFETSTASENFIEALENGSERYSSNITVENCTFTATDEAVNTAVGVQIKASKNAKVIGCTATNMHSLIQAQSCDESVLVQGSTVTGKNGVAFKQVKNAVVEGNTITATGYGIRFDGNTDNYGITVKGNEVTASQPFIVRKMTGKDNTITLEGTNTLTVSAASISTEAPAYQIVITNGSDDEAYVKPTGTYTLTGADNYLVYPRDVYFFVATWDEFTAALAANEPKIKLTDNIEYSANYQLQKDVVIDLNGKSMTLPMINIHKNVTIKNGTINGKMYARTGCKATLEGLTFSGTISDDLSTEGHLQVQGSCDVYAKNCTFAATTVNGSQTRSLSIEGSSSGIRKFEGCDFKFVSWGTGAGKYKKNVYINTMNGTTTVDFTDCKLNGKAPNILFAGTYSLKNLTMSGCDNTAPTLEINRAKDAVTEVEWAHISSLIANNKFTQVRVFYAGGSSEYIR